MLQSRSFVGLLRAATLGLAALCGAASMEPGQAAVINLVQNGDFTATTLASPGGYVCSQVSNSSCGSRVTSWSATCGTNGCTGGGTPTSILFPGTNGSAFNGNIGVYSVTNAPLGGNMLADDGDPQYSSALSQTITGLTPGHTYALTFYQAAAQQNGLTGATTENWKVTLGSSVQQSAVMNNASKGFVPWTKQTLTYTATLATAVLTFLSQGTPAGEPPISLLANVSLVDATVIPEPAALSLLGAGLFGLMVARRKASARRRDA